MLRKPSVGDRRGLAPPSVGKGMQLHQVVTQIEVSAEETGDSPFTLYELTFT
jgi:hypothetical protein